MPPTTPTLFSVDHSSHPGTGAGWDNDGSPKIPARFSAIGCHSTAVAGVRAGTPSTCCDLSSGTNDASAVVESCRAVWAGPGDEEALRTDVIRLRAGSAGTGIDQHSGQVTRVECIWRQEGLKVPRRQPKRGRLWLNDGSCIRRFHGGPPILPCSCGPNRHDGGDGLTTWRTVPVPAHTAVRLKLQRPCPDVSAVGRAHGGLQADFGTGQGSMPNRTPSRAMQILLSGPGPG